MVGVKVDSGVKVKVGVAVSAGGTGVDVGVCEGRLHASMVRNKAKAAACFLFI